MRVSVGDYLIAINGKQVRAGDNYWQLLNNRLNRKSEITFNSKSSEDGAWVTRIETISAGAYSQLRYERWVKERRQKSPEEIEAGRVLFSKFCFRCHGVNAISDGSVPDLRHLPPAWYDNFDKVVLASRLSS